MNKITLNAEERKLSGRKVKQLRKDGLLPANVYGRNVKSEMVQINTKEFEKVFDKSGETGLIELLVAGKKKPVLVHNIQKDPVRDEILHVDLLQVDLKQKVTAEVPIELIGESPAVKQGLGTVVQYITEIEVEALPENLPDKFEVNLDNLSEVDQSFQVKDINVNKSEVEIKKGDEEIIVKVEPQKAEKVEEPVTSGEEEAVEGEADQSGEEAEGSGKTEPEAGAKE